MTECANGHAIIPTTSIALSVIASPFVPSILLPPHLCLGHSHDWQARRVADPSSLAYLALAPILDDGLSDNNEVANRSRSQFRRSTHPCHACGLTDSDHLPCSSNRHP